MRKPINPRTKRDSPDQVANLNLSPLPALYRHSRFSTHQNNRYTVESTSDEEDPNTVPFFGPFSIGNSVPSSIGFKNYKIFAPKCDENNLSKIFEPINTKEIIKPSKEKEHNCAFKNTFSNKRAFSRGKKRNVQSRNFSLLSNPSNYRFTSNNSNFSLPVPAPVSETPKIELEIINGVRMRKVRKEREYEGGFPGAEDDTDPEYEYIHVFSDTDITSDSEYSADADEIVKIKGVKYLKPKDNPELAQFIQNQDFNSSYDSDAINGFGIFYDVSSADEN